MNAVDYFKQQFDQLETGVADTALSAARKDAFHTFSQLGIPTVRNEEWKYTRIGGLFNKEYNLPVSQTSASITSKDIENIRLPGSSDANELIFINGVFSFSLSVIRSAALVIIPLAEAAKNEYKDLVSKYFGQSRHYVKDGIHALNTAFMHDGIFIHIKGGKILEHPIYIYNITDARTNHVLAQPRSLVYIGEQVQVQLVETYNTIGFNDTITNQVMEIVVEKEARVTYCKIQNDIERSSQVSTTHIRQVGKSYLHSVVLSLSSGMVRNNLNIILEAEHCEAHLYGLYFQQGQSHIDNHTLVDNKSPNCLSNEFYKGILDGHSTGVFNGKIYVQPQAQKTNAYQSNKNVLLSDTASVNTKPQLEIFADDVKCSHGCTVGQLNEEGLFYLQSRGISKKMARALLLQAFAADILEQVQLAPVRTYAEQLISKRLEFISA